ncbi:MAG: hypothetical protein GVY27_10935, partial [Deinococcus-Thermus bacterium]|nr:hypothetical protein [Deinococcota bacterium]
MDAPEVEPPTLPPELDTALGGNRSVFRANGVQVVLTAVPAYWTLPVDAVVLPGDPTLSLGGEVGRAFDRQTGSGLLERLDSRIRETFKPGELIASNPIVLDRPEEMSEAIPAPTVVVATACSSATSTVGDLDGLVAAVRALVHLATERTYRSIALPLLGTGAGGLDDKPSVLRTIAEELLMGLQDAPGITAVVAVPDESLINTEVSASWAWSSDTEGGPETKAGGISLDDIETLLDDAETAKAAPIGSEAAEAKTEAMNEAEAGAAAEAEGEPDTDTPEPTNPLPPPPDRPTYSNDHLGRVSLARDDRLDIAPYVRSFARLIAARGVAAPLALGVFGHWGAGKSFFMRALDGEIAALAAEAAATVAEAGDADRGPWHDRIVPIWFNAWHYVDRNLWATLALSVFEAVTRELARGRTAEALRADLQGAAPSTREVKDLAEKRLGAAEQARVEAEDRLTSLTARRRAAEYRQLDTTLADADAETLLEETRAALDAIGLDGAADTVEAVHRLRDRLIDAKGRWAGLRGALGRSFASAGGTAVVIAGAVVVLAA